MGLIVAGAVLIAFAADDVMLFRKAPLDKPPEVLADKAREILQSIGHSERPDDTAFGFGSDDRSLDYLELDDDPARWDRLRGGRLPAMYFWYRQSPGHFNPVDRLGKVSPWDPPFRSKPGAVSLVLDLQARLLELRAGPTRTLGGAGLSDPPDWP